MKISRGIPAADIPQAAHLYWQAFGGKLGLLMRPNEKAQALVTRVMQPDHALAAHVDGKLVGLAGFKTPQGALVDGTLADFRAIYGPVSGTLRALGLSVLERDVDNTNFLLDGICVDASARGIGVGTALLSALEEEARARGYASLRLDVIDTNPRAQALYTRLGYHPTKTVRLGPLRHVFGFAASTTMIKQLA